MDRPSAYPCIWEENRISASMSRDEGGCADSVAPIAEGVAPAFTARGSSCVSRYRALANSTSAPPAVPRGGVMATGAQPML